MPDNTIRLVRCCVWLLVASTVLVAAQAASAQPATDGRKVYDEQLRVKLDQQQAIARHMGLDAGGWFSFAFFTYDDHISEKARTLRQYDLRAWASYTHQGVHTLYVRGLVGYDDWNTHDNPSNDSCDDYRDADVERAWYQFDYNRLVRNRTGLDPAAGFIIKVGRDFYQIGSGLALALPLDAVQLTGSLGNFEATGLAAMTVQDTPNIDASASVSDHMQRCFYGLEGRYTGFDHHEPYAYYLWQFDHTDERGEIDDQEYNYDSRYLGLGSRGNVLLPELHYRLEWILERGRGFAEGITGHREKVRAMAVDVALDYIMDIPRHPMVSFEYLWGSGDPDRRLSSGATDGGNQPGSDDEAFNAFGFRDTGLAFAPNIGNLHIWQLGASCLPLEPIDLFRKMEVGTKVFFYAKDRKGGAITDTAGTGQSTWVGWEWDAYLNWRVTSDVSWTVRYGVFQPGAAFDDKDCRHFLYTGMTYSF